jgi:hypothetical protein
MFGEAAIGFRSGRLPEYLSDDIFNDLIGSCHLRRQTTVRRLEMVLSCLDGAPRSRVIFGSATVTGAVMSPAFACGIDPLALMFIR